MHDETHFGPEIAVDGLPDWVDPDEVIMGKWQEWYHTSTWAHCYADPEAITAIRLRSDHPCYLVTRLSSDHPSYLAIERGFTYWPGGGSKQECDEVLFRDGRIDINDDMYHWKNTGAEDDIIGYRKRAEPAEDDGDYVRVKRMTLDEWTALWDQSGREELGRTLGIIREETPLEQFEREFGALNHESRHAVKAFTAWQKNNG